MSLSKRLTDLEQQSEPKRTSPLVVFIDPEKEADPPERFQTEADFEAWREARDASGPVVLLLPPRAR
jgi:hypothetical protein